MRPSNVLSFGPIPEHWEVRTLRRLLRAVPERNQPDLPLLSVLREKGVVLRDVSSRDGNHNFIPDDLATYKAVRHGQFAMNKMKAWQGSYGVSEFHGIVSPAYFVFDLLDGVDGAYFHTAIRSRAYVPYFAQASDGVRIGQWDMSLVKLREIPFLVPAPAEQTAIVRFLDYVDRLIRRYIRAKEKLIPLLEEQKQAVIDQGVTGQIDVRTGQTYPAYKDSGVGWLREVPEHWEIMRLKDVANVQTGFTLGKDYRGQRTISRPYLRVANVQAGRADLSNVKLVEVTPHEADKAALLPGDVLMTEGGDIDKLGRGCVWRGEIPGCLHQNHVFAVRCKRSRLSPEFLAGLMASQHGRTYFQLTAKQTTNLASTNSKTLGAFPVLLPPSTEQLAILEATAKGTKNLEDTVARTKRQMELLGEYRTRLIADVVTGKLDVRQAAASLPERDPVQTAEHPEANLGTAPDADSPFSELSTHSQPSNA